MWLEQIRHAGVERAEDGASATALLQRHQDGVFRGGLLEFADHADCEDELV